MCLLLIVQQPYRKSLKCGLTDIFLFFYCCHIIVIKSMDDARLASLSICLQEGLYNIYTRLWPINVIFKFIYMKNCMYHLKSLQKLYRGHLNGIYRFLIRIREIYGLKLCNCYQTVCFHNLKPHISLFLMRNRYVPFKCPLYKFWRAFKWYIQFFI